LSKPKLIYLVTEDWYFWSHRLPMARAARAAGFDVAVATRVSEYGERIQKEGFALHPLDWRRRSVGPIETARAVREVARLYRELKPAIVHHVALKPTVIGSLAAIAAGVPAVVNGLTGLGYVFSSRETKARIIRTALTPLLRKLLDRRNSILVLQNEDDRRLLTSLAIVSPERTTLIRGSGIDIGKFTPQPEPSHPPIIAAFVGRMLEDKGVQVLVEAVRLARRKGTDVHLRLIGTPDPENPTSIPLDVLRAWATEPGVEWLGHCDDIPAVWAACHVAVLPSRREGLPKSLLEAAACGRPIIATDVPGCREIALPGRNALLVPPDDASALASALSRLAEDHMLRAQFGRESRRIVEADMTADAVGARMAEIYRHLLPADTRWVQQVMPDPNPP
jgi:glycosyltransferase involved in cell wall biosynthesis